MKHFYAVLLLLCALCGAATAEGTLTPGTQTQRGFVNDNVLHSDIGDIHFSSYIPETYDGSVPYALFVTLPGWEGLYFQGVGANMVEDFGPEAIQYNERMIVLSPQLNDWGQTSANETMRWSSASSPATCSCRFSSLFSIMTSRLFSSCSIT